MAIRLEKNNTIVLKKDGDFKQGIDFLKVGLGWSKEVIISRKKEKKKLFGLVGTGEYDIVKERTMMNVDIDASIFLYNENKQPIGECSYRNLETYANGRTIVKHSGDERSGGKKGDNEVINLYLDRMLDTPVSYAYVVLNIYSPSLNFDAIQNAYVNLYDANGVVLAEFDLTENYEGKNGVIAAKLVKHKDSNGHKYWEFKALGDGIDDAARIDKIIKRAVKY